MLNFERFLAELFSPLPIIFLLFFLGLILLFLKKNKISYALLISAFVFFGIFGFPFLPNSLIQSKESRYYPVESVFSQLRSDINNSGRPLKWVVVLAGGICNDSNIPLTSKLSYKTLNRLIEGIRIYRRFPGSRLVLSGGSPEGSTVNEAKLMRQLALDLGVNKYDIVIENKSLETSQQAIMIKTIVGKDNFILLTSANHLERAKELFNNQGLKPFIYPADFLIKNSDVDNSFFLPIPNSNSFLLSEKAFYEFWANIGGKIKGDLQF